MSGTRSVAKWIAAGVGLAAASYAAYAGAAWYRYGHPPPGEPDARDDLLDQFMPVYDVVERHRIAVGAPADVTLAAAKEQDLTASPIVRAIFKAREIVLGATPDDRMQSRGLLAVMQSIGWSILSDVPGREVVVGAVTRPWEANVTFRALPSSDFLGFSEPGYVKIAWTLRADPSGDAASIFRTETRAIATDAYSRRKFRQYWAFASPGIAMIRWLLLQPLRDEAEKRMSHAG
jgi:hypothetical protein